MPYFLAPYSLSEIRTLCALIDGPYINENIEVETKSTLIYSLQRVFKAQPRNRTGVSIVFDDEGMNWYVVQWWMNSDQDSVIRFAVMGDNPPNGDVLRDWICARLDGVGECVGNYIVDCKDHSGLRAFWSAAVLSRQIKKRPSGINLCHRLYKAVHPDFEKTVEFILRGWRMPILPVTRTLKMAPCYERC